MSRMQSNRGRGRRWEVVHEIVKNLGKGWQVEVSALQDVGVYMAIASGPGSMKLFFIARTEKVERWFEHNCPPLGWLRVDGRLRLADKDLDAKISIMLPESLTADEMANEIIARLLPPYADFLGVVEKNNLETMRKS
jgi:hypothetical protein